MLRRDWRHGVPAGPASGVGHTAGCPARCAFGQPLPGEIWDGEWHLGKGPVWLGRMLPQGVCRDVVEQAEHLCLLVLLGRSCCSPLSGRKANAFFYIIFFFSVFFFKEH